MDQLEGRVAVVTGASSGIGLAVSRLCAIRGMRVVLVDVNRERLDQAVEALTLESLDVRGMPADVAEYPAIRRISETVYETYGAVHLLHLNAGIASTASLLDDVTEDWDRVIGVNLKGVVWGIKAFVPRMLAGGEEGFVLATSSGSGAEGTSFGLPGYASTKMAVVSIMECLYGQLRELSSNLQVGILLPPLTDTSIAGDDVLMSSVESHMRAAGIPASMVSPDQVAAMALDGVVRGRFFVRPSPDHGSRFFGDKMTAEFFEWNERMIRGRALAAIDGLPPDQYLW